MSDKWHLMLLAGILVLMAEPVSIARQIVIARNGKAAFTVENTMPADSGAAFAARQLQLYLGKISGAEFGAVNRPARKGKKILLGIDENLGPEEHSVDFRKGNILLSGGGRRGLIYAAYSFLEDLGCRWLSPEYDFYGGSGEYVPKKSTLVYSFEGQKRGQPELKYRKLYVKEGHSHTVGNLAQMIDWMGKMQYNVLVYPIDYQGKGKVVWDEVRSSVVPELKKRGIVVEVGGHGYQNFINAGMEDGKLFEEHSEYFGMADGVRSKEMSRVFCTSNPEAFEYMVGNLTEYLKTHPEIEIFDFWPPDGARWCECEKCRGIGSPSDQHSRLVSLTAERMEREVPGMKIECLGYSLYKEASEKYVLGKNVLVDFCPISQSFEFQIFDPSNKTNSGYVKALEGWKDRFSGDISIYSYYRKYAWHSLPILMPHYMQNDLKWYRDKGLSGISIYCEPGDWGTYEINLYVLGMLARNPDTDVDALLRDFAHCRFGDLDKIAMEAYGTIEDIARKGCSIPGTSLKSVTEYDAFLKRAGISLDAVENAIIAIAAAVPGATGNTAANCSAERGRFAALERLSLSLKILCKDLEIQRARAAGASREEIILMTDEMIEWAEGYFDKGVFLPAKVRKSLFYKQYGYPQTPRS